MTYVLETHTYLGQGGVALARRGWQPLTSSLQAGPILYNDPGECAAGTAAIDAEFHVPVPVKMNPIWYEYENRLIARAICTV
jgi:hypothetical protein